MVHRMLRYPAGWEWHVVQQARYSPLDQKPLPSRKTSAKQAAVEAGAAKRKARNSKQEHAEEQEYNQVMAFIRQFPECGSWMNESLARTANHISVDDLPDVGPLLCGTLMIQVSEDPSDVQPFHFWLSRNRLVTMHEDMRLPLRLQTGTHADKYEECILAPEAFFIMISVVLETFHAGLDGFERRLGQLEKTMRIQNRTGLLDVIFERRYDLLHWSHLFIPIRELHGAAKESFTDQLADKDAFIRITHKLERIETLLKHYALEIDTLISMDDAISSFKGNDIMKTLTIFTVLFLPATIAGTLMGSNFQWLPLRDHPWGFALMITGVSAITAGIYIWLWKKGWTGDLLHKRGEPLPLNEPAEQAGSLSRHHSTNKLAKRSRSAEAPVSGGVISTELPMRSRRNRV